MPKQYAAECAHAYPPPGHIMIFVHCKFYGLLVASFPVPPQPNFHRLQYGPYCKQQKNGRGLGERAIALFHRMDREQLCESSLQCLISKNCISLDRLLDESPTCMLVLLLLLLERIGSPF